MRDRRRFPPGPGARGRVFNKISRRYKKKKTSRDLFARRGRQ